MEVINYTLSGENMILTEDVQIVQGVSGNAAYLPAGTGHCACEGDRSELSLSLWRSWDGVTDNAEPRGVFKFKNLAVYFDSVTDFLTVEIEDVKTVTDIKDTQEETHWCFLFAKDKFFKIHKNGESVFTMPVGNYPVKMTEGFTLGGGRTHAVFDEVHAYTEILSEEEILGLYRLITKGTQVPHVEKLIENNVPLHTPHYLGTVETPPDGRRVNIHLGRKTGFVEANISDWILITGTFAPYERGLCYRFDGHTWEILEPPEAYVQEYTACLTDLMKLKDLFKDAKFFGTVFCKYLGFNEAVGQSLAVNKAFLKDLIVQRLKIDSDINDNEDFEVLINENDGIVAKNGKITIFRISPLGIVELPDCIMYPETQHSFVTITVEAGGDIAEALYREKRRFVNNEGVREEENEVTYCIHDNIIENGYEGTYDGIPIKKIEVQETIENTGESEIYAYDYTERFYSEEEMDRIIENGGDSSMTSTYNIIWHEVLKKRKTKTRTLFFKTGGSAALIEQGEFYDLATPDRTWAETSYNSPDKTSLDGGYKKTRPCITPKKIIFTKKNTQTRYQKKIKDLSVWEQN